MSFFRPFAAALLFLALGACNDAAVDLSASRSAIRAPGIPVALLSLDGPPASVSARLVGALGSAARQREISVVAGAANPRYQVRGYLSATGGENATTDVTWVWDIFDQSRQRAQRVSGGETLRRAAPDPWDTLDEAVLQRLAARSMDEIAGFLAASPEAIPVAAAPAAAAPAAAGRSRALGFAPAE